MLSIILARRDFRENDQIISLYTVEKGKLEVLARGVKKINSKNAAYLEPCFLVEADIIGGKGMTHLTRAQPIEMFKNIRLDLDKISLVGYLMRLLDQLLKPGAPDKHIFYLLVDFLEFLNGTKEVSPLLLDNFLIKLFSLLGFDLVYAENLDPMIKKQIIILAKSDWNNLPIGLDKKFVQALRRAVHDFMIYHSERKLAYFSQI